MTQNRNVDAHVVHDSNKINKTTKIKRKVQVWIYCSNFSIGSTIQFLLLKTNSIRGGFWQPVTGKVNENEPLIQAALREAKEETGFKFKNDPLFLNYEFTYEKENQIFQESVFCLEVDKIEKPVLDSQEHVDSKWSSGAEAMNLLKYDSNKRGLACFLRKQLQGR